MSGDGLGIIGIPIVLCLAAPVAIAGAAIFATGAAVVGAVKLGQYMYEGHVTRKEQKAQELRNSGLEPRIANVYDEVVASGKNVATIYNRQTLRIADDVEQYRKECYRKLQSQDIKTQVAFQEQIDELRHAALQAEHEKAGALKKAIRDLTDAEDRKLNAELAKVNADIRGKIKNIRNQVTAKEQASRDLANQYYQSAGQLLATLKDTYQGEKFCKAECESIDHLMQKCGEVMDTAPETAYALAWDAVETALLAMNQAENLQQEWLMQYRTALVLAEEIQSVIREEGRLGYKVGREWAETLEQAKEICRTKHLPESEIMELSADDYVYGELAELKEAFDKCYAALHEKDGEELSLEELYTMIDDLHVKYGTEVRKLMFEARMNLNEALTIDRIEEELNHALGGGYHYGGSARSGCCHNGEKHILFERDGNPDEEICVVLKNGGWGENGQGQLVMNTAIEIKSVKDNQISEKKRSVIRSRISRYLGSKIEGSQTSIHCVAGTEGRLTADRRAADLRRVEAATVKR